MEEFWCVSLVLPERGNGGHCIYSSKNGLVTHPGEYRKKVVGLQAPEAHQLDAYKQAGSDEAAAHGIQTPDLGDGGVDGSQYGRHCLLGCRSLGWVVHDGWWFGR